MPRFGASGPLKRPSMTIPASDDAKIQSGDKPSLVFPIKWIPSPPVLLVVVRGRDVLGIRLVYALGKCHFLCSSGPAWSPFDRNIIRKQR